MPKLAAKMKYKATRAIAIGEEIDIDGEADVTQETFDLSVSDRIRRLRAEEKDKLDGAIAKQNELQREIEELKGKGQKPDEKMQAEMAKMQAETKRLTDQLAERDAKAKVDEAIDRKAKDLPKVFRERIRVKHDASQEEIDAAIEAQLVDYKELKKTMGVEDDKGGDKGGDHGRGGNGSANEPKPAETAAALARVRAEAPKLAQTLSAYDEKTQGTVALNWVNDGTLAKATAKA